MKQPLGTPQQNPPPWQALPIHHVLSPTFLPWPEEGCAFTVRLLPQPCFSVLGETPDPPWASLHPLCQQLMPSARGGSSGQEGGGRRLLSSPQRACNRPQRSIIAGHFKPAQLSFPPSFLPAPARARAFQPQLCLGNPLILLGPLPIATSIISAPFRDSLSLPGL